MIIKQLHKIEYPPIRQQENNSIVLNSLSLLHNLKITQEHEVMQGTFENPMTQN